MHTLFQRVPPNIRLMMLSSRSINSLDSSILLLKISSCILSRAHLGDVSTVVKNGGWRKRILLVKTPVHLAAHISLEITVTMQPLHPQMHMGLLHLLNVLMLFAS
jgi:hypothetical protein